MNVTGSHHQQGPALSRLRAAKDLFASRDRPVAALRMTQGDGSNGQGLFFKLNLALQLQCQIFSRPYNTMHKPGKKSADSS
jgi:hypothetical protein